MLTNYTIFRFSLTHTLFLSSFEIYTILSRSYRAHHTYTLLMLQMCVKNSEVRYFFSPFSAKTFIL